MPAFLLQMGTFANNCYCPWHFPINTSRLQACPFHNTKGRKETSFIVLYLTKIPFGSIPQQESWWPGQNQSFFIGSGTQALKAPGHAAKALFAVPPPFYTAAQRPSTWLQSDLGANLLVSTCSGSVFLSLTGINVYSNRTAVLWLFLHCKCKL